ncbi:MAG: elongation factor Ts [Anaerolineae bacterium]|nr:elongation factor Ts [Anaerolineae bacterium]
MIKELRDATSAGVLDCREALEATDADFEEAVAYLREKGMSEAAQKSDSAASEGIVEAYIHHGSQVGVLLELNCETDFVARTDDFKTMAHNLALHIAFAAPSYLTRDDVPEEVLKSEREIYRKRALEEGKPEHIIDRIVEGRLDKFFEQTCLMEQRFVKNEDKSIEDLINESVTAFGENIVVGRFERYEVGE